MNAVRKPMHGHFMMFITAMGLASGAGFWLGKVRYDAWSGETRREVSVLADRKRNVAAKTPPLTAVALVHESLRGAVNERH